MSYRPKLQLHPPANWQDFETLCLGLWKTIWKDSNAQRNGRQGQPQHGVDVFGQPGCGSSWAGVQCKGKECFTSQMLTNAEVTKEVKKAKKFSPRLAEFTIATTAPKDGQMQTHIRNMAPQLKKGGWFRLSVCGWDDIEELLYEHEPIIAQRFYPDVFSGKLPGFLKLLLNRLPESRPNVAAQVATTNYAAEGHAEVCEGAIAENQSDVGQVNLRVGESVAGQEKARARDVGLALGFLARLEDEFVRHSEAHGATSADATLAEAVNRAVESEVSHD